MQSQDFPGAKWSVGRRLLDATDASVEQAYNEGSILRTHVMRPTWHFVAPEDIRWLLELTAPRVHVASAYQYRQLELDDDLFARSNRVIEKALRGGKHLTRPELAAELERGGIAAVGLRLVYLIMHAELDAVICSGPRRGNQFTYALLAERAHAPRSLPRDEALAELTRRYFTSHGPATVYDFSWWSGLTVADVRAGLEMSKAHLMSDTLEGKTYWFASQTAIVPGGFDITRAAYLLPTYDEYTIAYTDRSSLVDPQFAEKANTGTQPIVPFQAQVVVGGKVLGQWKRTVKKHEVMLDLHLFRSLTDDEASALDGEVARYSKFMGLPATMHSQLI
jgi:hypothetical protein